MMRMRRSLRDCNCCKSSSVSGGVYSNSNDEYGSVGFQALEEGSTSNTSNYTPPTGRDGEAHNNNIQYSKITTNKKTRSIRRFFAPTAGLGSSSSPGRNNRRNHANKKSTSLKSVSQASSDNASSRQTPQPVALLLSCSTDIGSNNDGESQRHLTATTSKSRSNDAEEDSSLPAPSDENMFTKGPIDLDTGEVFRPMSGPGSGLYHHAAATTTHDHLRRGLGGGGGGFGLYNNIPSSSVGTTSESRSTNNDVDDPSITDILENLSDYNDVSQQQRRKSVEERRRSLEAMTKSSSYDSCSDEEEAVLIASTQHGSSRRLSRIRQSQQHSTFQVPSLAFWPPSSKPGNSLNHNSKDADQHTVSTKEHTLTEGEDGSITVRAIEWDTDSDNNNNIVNGQVSGAGATNPFPALSSPARDLRPLGDQSHWQQQQQQQHHGKTPEQAPPQDAHPGDNFFLAGMERAESSSYYTPISPNFMSSDENSSLDFTFDDSAMIRPSRGLAESDEVASSYSTRMSYSRTMTMDNEDELALRLQPTDFSWISSSNHRTDTVPSPEFVMQPRGSFGDVGINVQLASGSTTKHHGNDQPDDSVARAQEDQVGHHTSSTLHDQAADAENGVRKHVRAPTELMNMKAAIGTPPPPPPPPPQSSVNNAPGTNKSAEISKLKSSWKTDPIAIIPFPSFATPSPTTSSGPATSPRGEEEKLSVSPPMIHPDDSMQTLPGTNSSIEQPLTNETSTTNDSTVALQGGSQDMGVSQEEKSPRRPLEDENETAHTAMPIASDSAELVAWPDMDEDQNDDENEESRANPNRVYHSFVEKPTRLQRKVQQEQEEASTTDDYPSSGVITVTPPPRLMPDGKVPREAVPQDRRTTEAPHMQSAAAKFMLFDEQKDAFLLHKPMPVRATYHPVSLPVVLDGPQGPASLSYNRTNVAPPPPTTSTSSSVSPPSANSLMIAAQPSATTPVAVASMQDTLRKADDSVVTKPGRQPTKDVTENNLLHSSDTFDIDDPNNSFLSAATSMPSATGTSISRQHTAEQELEFEGYISPHQFQGKASSGGVASFSDTSSLDTLSETRRSVQSYWEQRIANASPILPPRRDISPITRNRSGSLGAAHPRQGSNVMMKIQALEKQFYGDDW